MALNPATRVNVRDNYKKTLQRIAAAGVAFLIGRLIWDKIVLAPSRTLVVLGADRALHVCRLTGSPISGIQVLRSFPLYGDGVDMYLWALDISPANDYYTYLTNEYIAPDSITDTGFSLIPFRKGGSALSFTDNGLSQYLPKSVLSSPASKMPKGLKELQAGYDAEAKNLKAETGDDLSSTLSAVFIGDDVAQDGGASSLDSVSWPDASTIVITGTTVWKVDAETDLIGDFSTTTYSTPVWLALPLPKTTGEWKLASHGFDLAKAPVIPQRKPLYELALGAGTGSGLELLLDGKQLKLPAALGGGVLDFAGPWV